MAAEDLSGNELEVLRILWDRRELKPMEIQDAFAWPIENATLRSVLVNLVEKGYLARRLDGKAFRYAAVVPKTALLRSTMHALARVFSGGSMRELVAQFAATEDLEPSDLELLRKAAGGRPPKTRRPRK